MLLVMFVTFAADAQAAKKKKKKKPGTTEQTVNGGELDAPKPAGAPAEAAAAGGGGGETPAAPSSAPSTPPEDPSGAASGVAPDADEAHPAEAPKPTASLSGGFFHIAGPRTLGSKHTLVIDDLSGFRASSVGGVAYSGPIGFSIQSFSEGIPAPSGASGGSYTYHYTSFWFAPSADYFLFDHLSIGLLLEIATTSGNYDQSLFGAATTNHSLPSTTDFTFLPRVGWMIPLGDHWGVWPRIGLGYGTHSSASATTAGSDSYGAFLLDLDAGVVYRMTATWFLRAAPELTFGPGSHSIQSGNTSVSLGASLVDFAVAGGFGFMWSL
jgi:hypothetical protein